MFYPTQMVAIIGANRIFEGQVSKVTPTGQVVVDKLYRSPTSKVVYKREQLRFSKQGTASSYYFQNQKVIPRIVPMTESIQKEIDQQMEKKHLARKLEDASWRDLPLEALEQIIQIIEDTKK